MAKQSVSLGEDLLESAKPLLGPLVREAYRWYQDAVLARLAARGEPALSLAQFEVFARVDWKGTSISELARRMGTARQSAHQAVGELAAAGLVTLEPDPTSSRSKLVRPTRQAHARLALVREVLAEIEEQLATRLGRSKLEQLRKLLDADWGDPAGH